MGLDAYIYKIEEEGETLVQYYCKNNQLQGFFEEHYDQENCEYTDITVEVCDKLMEANLRVTEGFFYGGFMMDKEQREEMNKLFMMIKDDITRNEAEYKYYCWY